MIHNHGRRCDSKDTSEQVGYHTSGHLVESASLPMMAYTSRQVADVTLLR